MLVLTRRPGESLILENSLNGDKITIYMHGIKGTQARIGIDAPKWIHISRDDMKKTDVRNRGNEI